MRTRFGLERLRRGGVVLLEFESIYSRDARGRAHVRSHVRIDSLGVELASCEQHCHLGGRGSGSARVLALRARTECARALPGYHTPACLGARATAAKHAWNESQGVPVPKIRCHAE